jgi:WD repeat-containing protein 35
MASSKYAVGGASKTPTAFVAEQAAAKIGGASGGNKSRFAQMEELKKNAGTGSAVDPAPTFVPKRSASRKITTNKGKIKPGELTWGEEAQALSNMVRAKYQMHDGKDTDPTKITQNQMKLLYLIHQYSFASTDQPDKECWIRRIPVLVLLYEGIVSQIFDYDYAPSLEVFQANRVYLNITQEGKDDIDDLREGGYVEALTLASSEYDQCLAYTTKRTRSDPLLAAMSQEWKDEVDSLLMSPQQKADTAGTKLATFTRDERLLEIYWNKEDAEFEIVSHSGYHRRSTITDIEDVSYVCSPFIPSVLRSNSDGSSGRGKMATDLQRNEAIAKHAVEFIKTHQADNIQDELDEVLKAHGVLILVSEWIPFGSNQMANLNDKLGSVKRVQGGLFSAFTDDMPEGTRFEHSVTSQGHMIKIADYELTEFVNFTADIFFEEDEGIIQIEEFGVSVRQDGSIMYGLQVESVLDRLYRNISMDHLSRLLVDIIQDSSHVAHNLLSVYQRTMLNVLFSDRPTLRPKYRVIVCEDLEPMLVAEKYMDKEDFENEIKQVIGDTRTGHDLGPREVVVFGRDGLLIAGKRVARFEGILVRYAQLEARDHTLRAFFRRTFQLSDVIKETRGMIVNFEKDPGSMRRTRMLLTKTERDLILLKELLCYVDESLIHMANAPRLPAPDPSDVGAVELTRLTDNGKYLLNLKSRTADMQKNIEGLQTSMKALYMLTDANAEAEMFRLVKQQVTNGKNLEDVMRAGERSSSSLEIMQVILAGSLAFDIIDRVSTLYMSYDHEQLEDGLGTPIPGQEFWTWWVVAARIPGGWLAINLGFWVILGYCLIKYMRHLAENANGVLSCRLTVNCKVHLDKLSTFLKKRALLTEEGDCDKHQHTRTVSWCEKDSKRWKGKYPTVEIIYDVNNSFLLSVTLEVEQNYGTWTEKSLRRRCTFVVCCFVFLSGLFCGAHIS